MATELPGVTVRVSPCLTAQRDTVGDSQALKDLFQQMWDGKVAHASLAVDDTVLRQLFQRRKRKLKELKAAMERKKGSSTFSKFN